MSNTIKLSSKLPGDAEINGLDSRQEHFLHDGETPICALVWVVATKVTRDLATDEEVPTVEIRRIEPIGTPSAVPQAIQDLASELYEKRTGRNPLPFSSLLVPAGEVGNLDDAGWPRDDQDGPRLARDPSQIGDAVAHVFDGREDN